MGLKPLSFGDFHNELLKVQYDVSCKHITDF